jgi:hypothetical protein
MKGGILRVGERDGFLGSVKRSSILIRYPVRQKGSRLVAEGWVDR